jgi:hypothetical protein
VCRAGGRHNLRCLKLSSCPTATCRVGRPQGCLGRTHGPTATTGLEGNKPLQFWARLPAQGLSYCYLVGGTVRRGS